jgi:hypothetical protein
MYDDTITVDKAYYNKLKEQTTWISVDDRLPEQYTDVIVLYDIGRVGVNWTNTENEFVSHAYCKVTHWMPLPQKPESEEE